MYPNDSPKACCYSANDPARSPSHFYYWDMLYSSIIGCLVMQGGRVHKWPRTSFLSALCQNHLHPILPFISSVLLFSSCSSMDGLCGRLAKVEQALFSPSVWVIVLASKGTGFADVKGSNSPNGVHINVH